VDKTLEMQKLVVTSLKDEAIPGSPHRVSWDEVIMGADPQIVSVGQGLDPADIYSQNVTVNYVGTETEAQMRAKIEGAFCYQGSCGSSTVKAYLQAQGLKLRVVKLPVPPMPQSRTYLRQVRAKR
jgi:hypothetical protein